MKFSRIVTGIATAAVIASFAMYAVPAAAVISEPGFEAEVVAGGFVLPTAIAFASDGRIFVAEKGGTVRVIKDGVVLPQPVLSLTDVNTFGDRGLLGIAVDPEFATNGYLYLSYTFENTPGANFSGPKTGRIVRVTVVGDSASEASRVVLVGTVGGSVDAPSCLDQAYGADCIASDSMSHSVGGLRFGKDGYLYASLGDGSNFDQVDPRALRAQDLGTLSGKVLRIDRDGHAPASNPFYDGDEHSNRSRVYAYGFRNAFRFNFHPVTGMLLIGDVGWSNWEEVNRVTAGSNYGWPCNEGMLPTSYGCTVSGATNPTYTYPHDENGAGSVSAGTFSANGVYPAEYATSWFFGDYAQNWIKRLVIDANNNVTAVVPFMDDPDGPVDVSTGLDGNVYYLSIYTGELHRITHTAGNRRPVTVAAASPLSGATPLATLFSSVGSYDPDGDALSYSWDFGDGSDTSALPNPSHTYTVDGTYAAVLTVTDVHGSVAAKSVTVHVGNQAPVPTIVAPVSGSLFTENQTIQLIGQGLDSEDGPLEETMLHWTVILHHNVHTHVLQEFDETSAATFVAPDHGSDDVYLEIVLTVRDVTGLTSSQSVNMYHDNGGSTSGNLIANPSVEAESSVAGIPTGWIKGGYGVNTAILTYPVPGLAGDRAIGLTVADYQDGNAKWYFDPVFVTGGRQYAFADTYTATVPSSLYAQFGFNDGTYQYQDLGGLVATAEAARAERVITVPDGVQTLTVFHQLWQNGTLITDDFSLTLIGADVTAPVVAITAPAGAATVSGLITVTAAATDNVGVAGVYVFVDGVAVGAEDTTEPFTFAWNSALVASGDHAIVARARDAAGNFTDSAPVTVHVLNDGAPVNLILNGSFEDESGGLPVGWLSVGWGNHTRIHPYPAVGRDGGKAATVQITAYPANGDGDARWQHVEVPVTAGTEYTYSDWYVSNTISDSIGRYTMADGSYHYFGVAKEIQPTTAWAELSATFTAPEGATHVSVLHLISSVGFLTLDDVSLVATGAGTPDETEPPTVSFASPLHNATVSGTVALQAISADNVGVTGLQFAVDGIPVGPLQTVAPYALQWDSTTVANGIHTLKATSHDAVGNNAAITISVDVQNVDHPPVSDNLIGNPSLETVGGNGDPTGWFRGGWGTNTRAFAYPVAGVTGANAAQVAMTSHADGDAKWYFAEVAVTPGDTYVFSHSYMATVSTGVTYRFTREDGTVQYVGGGNFPAAATWTALTDTFVVPANAVSMTVFRTLNAVGSLTIDNYSLTHGVLHAFVRGKVSLTFDDGWLSHYDTAMPLLNAAGMDGTFYIITDETNHAVPVQLFDNATLEAAAGGDPVGWFRGGWGTHDAVLTYPAAGRNGGSAARVDITSYTEGDAKWYPADVPVLTSQEYVITDFYNSTSDSQTVIRYTLTEGATQYAYLGVLPATGGAWQRFTQHITTPANVVSMTLFHVLAEVGSLSVDDFSLYRVQDFIDPAMVLELQSYGHDIGAHSKTHPYLTTLSGTALTNEVAGARTDLLAMGVTDVRSLAYPYGDVDASVVAATQAAGYSTARGVDRGFNNSASDRYALKIQQVDRTTTLADVQGWVQQAAADRMWLILMFHQIDENPSADLGVDPGLFEQMLGVVGDAEVDVVTMTQGATLLQP